MEPVQTHLINDVITVQNSDIDWVALFALAISIFALWLQHHVRKKDLVEQRKNADADEKMRKWSAAYPYKLKLFTDFCQLFVFCINLFEHVDNLDVLRAVAFTASAFNTVLCVIADFFILL